MMKLCGVGLGSSSLAVMGFSPTELQASVRQFKTAKTARAYGMTAVDTQARI